MSKLLLTACASAVLFGAFAACTAEVSTTPAAAAAPESPAATAASENAAEMVTVSLELPGMT